jgi:hypothetical protein
MQQLESLLKVRRRFWGFGPEPVVKAPSFPMAVLTDIGDRGATDVFFRLCDGLKGRTRCGSKRMATGDGANVHHSPHQGFLPARIMQILG